MAVLSLNDLKAKYGDALSADDYTKYGYFAPSAQQNSTALTNSYNSLKGAFKGSKSYGLDTYLKDYQALGAGGAKENLFNAYKTGAEGDYLAYMKSIGQDPESFGDRSRAAWMMNTFNKDYMPKINGMIDPYLKLQSSSQDIQKKADALYGTYDTQLTNYKNTQAAKKLSDLTGQDPGKFVGATEEDLKHYQNMQNTLSMWDNLFGKSQDQAMQQAQTALTSDISGLQRQQQELSAQSGRSALGGGYQAGAAQAALSAGGKQAQLQSDFYNQKVQRQQSFLQAEMDRASLEGRTKDASDLAILLANIGLQGDLGNAQALSEQYRQLSNPTYHYGQ